ncbi:MAG: hypothetical protein ACJ75J_02870 [Cytophagaceae bacterium]
MKNFKLPLLVLTGFVFLLSAFILKSSEKAAGDKKVALVTFYCDKKIGGTGLGTVTESLMNDPNFNLQPTVEKAYTRFITEFAKDFPFKLEEKSFVTGNKAYQDYKSKFLWDTTKGFNKLAGLQYAVVPDFVFAYPAGSTLKDEKRDECNMLKIFNTSDGVMFVRLDYEIEPRMQGLAAGVTAYITFELFDKSCNKVFRIREYGKSTKKVPAVAGIPVMKSEKIQPLCEDATDVLFKELQTKLPKIAKKSANF